MKVNIMETNNIQHNLETGMEFAFHRAILSLKMIHEFDSETIQTLVGLICQTLGPSLNAQDDSEFIYEEDSFADDYTDRLFAQEDDFVNMYGQEGFDFLVNAVLYFGGLDPEEMACE